MNKDNKNGNDGRRKDINNTYIDPATGKFVANPLAKGGFKKGVSGNPKGRGASKNASTKTSMEIRKGLLDIFKNSSGPAIIRSMLNGKIPPQFVPIFLDENGKRIPVDLWEGPMWMTVIAQARKDYKWAFEQLVKMMPKELGVYGKLEMQHTLAGRVKDALTKEKSKKVIDLAKKRKDRYLIEYGLVEDEPVDEETGEDTED